MKIKISGLDKKFSHYIRWIRDGGKCQRCGTQYFPPSSALHCSHFWGRGKQSTRFEEWNVASCCYGCHRYLTAHPEEHRDFFLKRLGQWKYDVLMIKANTPKRPDYVGINIWLDQEIRNAQPKAIGSKA
jgi:5-methylcytosine-specific restriction endonuclease McrA